MKACKLIDDQRGIGHLIMIVAGVLVLGIVGFTSFRVYSNQNSDPGDEGETTSQSDDLSDAETSELTPATDVE